MSKSDACFVEVFLIDAPFSQAAPLLNLHFLLIKLNIYIQTFLILDRYVSAFETPNILLDLHGFCSGSSQTFFGIV